MSTLGDVYRGAAISGIYFRFVMALDPSKCCIMQGTPMDLRYKVSYVYEVYSALHTNDYEVLRVLCLVHCDICSAPAIRGSQNTFSWTAGRERR